MDIFTVLIADDHPVFRRGLRTLLATMPTTEFVGEATNGPEAVELAEMLQPDLVLMDLRMPGDGGGMAAIRRIVETSPHIRILVISMLQDDESVFTAMRAGARGYVLKDAGDEEIMRAILAVGNGEAIFSPDIAGRMMSYFAARPAGQTELLPDLTASERNVLRLMAQGRSNEAIARELGFTVKTVRNYTSNIFSKLQVSSRLEAVLKARDAGMA